MYYLKKRIEIAGSHKLNLPYKSKCSNLHGHNWIITVYCKAKKLNEAGMVIDFSTIKDVVMQFDHKNLNDFQDLKQPTAENMAKVICGLIKSCYKVEIQESEGNVITYEPD